MFILITDKEPGDLLDYKLHLGMFLFEKIVRLNISAYFSWVISIKNGFQNDAHKLQHLD